MINSPTKVGRRESIARSPTRLPGQPNKHMALAMNELMKKMGFLNITKLKELKMKSHVEEEEDDV